MSKQLPMFPGGDDTRVSNRIGGTTIAIIERQDPEPEYVIETATLAGMNKSREIKPRKTRAHIDPELRAARERAAEYFAPLITTRMIAERDLLSLDHIGGSADVAKILRPYYDGLDKEHMLTICLNTKNRVLGVHVCYVGSVHTTVIRISELFRTAVLMNAPGIILAHNHPSGDPTPSPEDATVTREIVKAGAILDVDVLDHVILGANERFVSLKERGLGF